MSVTEGRSRESAPVDFDAIRDAVMETPRGRWFLSEYANRLNTGGTASLLDSMKRLENAVAANHDALMSRLAEALERGPSPAPAAAQTDLAPKHMKFFKRDEDIFEPAPQAAITVVKEAPKPEVQKGARVVIRRSGETQSPPEPIAGLQPETPAEVPGATEVVVSLTEVEVSVSPAPAPLPAPEPPEAEAAPKRRIVIIRHKSGETIDVPLQNEMAQAS